jgi:beta-ribofuranosylaminobenzene 5'-phosphate synthase
MSTRNAAQPGSSLSPGSVDGQPVFVEAAARLHFGVLDLGGALGRWFGGIGAAAPAPSLLVSAQPADVLHVEGEDADRAADFARRFQAHFGVTRGARIVVHRALPQHAGLGSGTQLALAVARALSEVHGVDADVPELARAVGRGERSAIGTWTFAGGGLVVEGGRRPARDASGPLLARLPFPSSWQCVLAVPEGSRGLHGADEAAAFARLPPPPVRQAEHVAHLVLMALLPALIESDLPTFGAALSEIQSITGGWFAPAQGATFAPGPAEELVRRMTEWGASGVGQSSWGPAVYGIVDGREAGRTLANRVRDLFARSGAGAVYDGPFHAEGARVWRAPVQPALR